MYSAFVNCFFTSAQNVYVFILKGVTTGYKWSCWKRGRCINIAWDVSIVFWQLVFLIKQKVKAAAHVTEAE